MKILKFGGTSVGSVESISSLLEIIRQEIKSSANPVIVLSAMGGITNLLGVMAESAANGQSYEQELKLLEARHFDGSARHPWMDSCTPRLFQPSTVLTFLTGHAHIRKSIAAIAANPPAKKKANTAL